jgi:hypothetical protein
MKALAALTALTLFAVPVTPRAISQAAPQNQSYSTAGVLQDPLPPCDGVYSIVRLVELKPGVGIDQYMTALAAHQAWYKKHGYDDLIYAQRVIERDPDAGTAVYSKHTILSHHYFKPTSSRPKTDAEWDAFMKMYTDASDLKESYFACVPAAHVPRSMQ